MAIIVYFAGAKKFLSFIYLFIAIFTTIYTPNFSDYSGVIGFIIAFDLIKKKEYGIFIIVVSAISLGIRLIVSDETIPRTLAMILIFSFWFLSYYTVIYQRYVQPVTSKLSGLTTSENELLRKMCDGKPQGLAGSEIGHKNKQETSKMMARIRDKLYLDDSQSNDKVIYLFTKHGK